MHLYHVLYRSSISATSFWVLRQAPLYVLWVLAKTYAVSFCAAVHGSLQLSEMCQGPTPPGPLHDHGPICIDWTEAMTDTTGWLQAGILNQLRNWYRKLYNSLYHYIYCTGPGTRLLAQERLAIWDCGYCSRPLLCKWYSFPNRSEQKTLHPQVCWTHGAALTPPERTL